MQDPRLLREVGDLPSRIEGDIKALETKSSIISPIITGVTVAFVGGVLLARSKSLL